MSLSGREQVLESKLGRKSFNRKGTISRQRKWLYVAIVLVTAIGGQLVGNNLKNQVRVSEAQAEQPVVKQETKKPVKVARKSMSTNKKVYVNSYVNTKLNNNICVIAMKKVFPKHLWATGEAIMRAESGARPNAIGGPNYNGTYDYGCWQINDTKRALDPDVGTKIAWYKYNHSGWNPWTVYRTGSYKRFL